MGIKVLHLIDSGGLYGAEKMLLSLVKEQVRQGLEPTILSAGEPGIEEKAIEAEARKKGLSVVPWRMQPGLNLKESWRILKWAQRNNFDLLHSHGFKFNVLLGMYPKSIRRIPMISTLHGYVHAKRYSKMWLYECLDRLALHRIEGIVLVSAEMEKELIGIKPKKTRSKVIENGIDICGVQEKGNSQLANNIEKFVNQHSPVFIGVGRLSREKGFELLVKAFSRVKKKHPRSGLVLAGNGKERDRLLKLTEQLACSESVIFTGYYDNIPSLLKSVDVLVMPSLTEGLPIVLLEAMAVNVPIIASSVGEIPRVLGNGAGGRLLKSGTVEDIECAMLDYLSAPLDTVRFRDWAMSRVENKFSDINMALRYKEFYFTIFEKNTALPK